MKKTTVEKLNKVLDVTGDLNPVVRNTDKVIATTDLAIVTHAIFFTPLVLLCIRNHHQGQPSLGLV